ncbi:MAG: leucyl/phenylalanyl-tRNA--protein transferase [Gallionella sp.]
MIPWLTDNDSFPPIGLALRSPNGLLAAGGDLSVARLLNAYRNGIFPWFNHGEPILWWSPDPRMVLIPSQFKPSRSLAKVLRNSTYEVRLNSAFEHVMRACAAPRTKYPDTHHGTWIGEDMITAYCALHHLGYAHSVEVWANKELFQFNFEGQIRQQREIDAGSAIFSTISEQGSQHGFTDEIGLELVGGLYGVSIGRMFYGESMFSVVSNASKIALAHLARQLDRWQFGMIDCQMNTPHLSTLGAREIPRSEFIARLHKLVHCSPVTNWNFDSGPFT